MAFEQYFRTAREGTADNIEAQKVTAQRFRGQREGKILQLNK
jgi:hypothetical protein